MNFFSIYHCYVILFSYFVDPRKSYKICENLNKFIFLSLELINVEVLYNISINTNISVCKYYVSPVPFVL